MARIAFVMDKLLRKDRPFGQEHSADAHRLRLHGACRHVEPDTAVGQGTER